MKPGRVSLTIVQGATFRQRFLWKAPVVQGGPAVPKDLTSWTAKAQVRINGRVALTFDTTDATIVCGSDGTIELHAAAAVVSAAKAGAGTWSLEMQPPAGGDRVVLLAGPVTIVQEVTT
jgi:hypothetical protein